MPTDKAQTGSRNALITGSGRNIGRACALELARRGFNVVINGSSDKSACDKVAKEAEALGVRALVAMANIGKHADAESLAEQAINTFGSVDVLVNNAAIRPNFDFLGGSLDDWNDIMNINFNSSLWLSRACLPGMIDRQWGRVINFTGMNAQQGYSGKSAVSVSKHAAWALTKSLAKEFGPQGITSNIISPGTIDGEVNEPAIEAKFDNLRSANPSGRLGTPGDIAAAVGYLCSNDAGFVNGQILQINGGVIV
ncbi:MAG: SDR family oxidoreductase [Granulosicoccus sp.]|nr:SDR family oxidoreductase [Granulosicoccus sp.]